MISIYCIHCITSGKKYVGQTKQDIMKRFTQHMGLHNFSGRYSHRKPRMRLAVEKHGRDAFYIGLIEQVDKSIADERETYWIKKLDTYKNGYNTKSEGQGNIVSDETRAKMSAAKKGKPSNRKGKKRTPEEIAKVKATLAKRKEMGLPVGRKKGCVPWNKGLKKSPQLV